MKQLKEEYPKWLEENWQQVSQEELKKYNDQLDIINKICELYEKDEIGESENNQIFELLGKLQELGTPPSSLMEELTNKQLGKDTAKLFKKSE